MNQAGHTRPSWRLDPTPRQKISEVRPVSPPMPANYRAHVLKPFFIVWFLALHGFLLYLVETEGTWVALKNCYNGQQKRRIISVLRIYAHWQRWPILFLTGRAGL